MKSIITFTCMIFTTISCNNKVSQQESQTYNTIELKDMITAVKSNDIQSLKTALENGANVNTIDNSQRSLLLLAVENKNLEIAKLLVEYNADVNQQANNLDSPFLYAGATGQTEMLKLFLANGARFDVFNRYGGSALIPACERGHVETVRLLANTPNFPINHINRLGWTGLIEAVILGDGSRNYQEIVQILKDAGAKMDIPDKEGLTPLQHAKNKGFKEIVDIINQ